MKTSFPLSLSIQYPDPRLKTLASRQQIRRWVKAALERPAILAIRFVDEAEGHVMNREFRHKDYATNVLTFYYDLLPHERGSNTHETEAPVQADIVLCTDVILAEAKEQGKSSQEHLAHLIIHGTLHAQGHDHETENDAQEMEARETAILARFGIADPYVET